LDHLPGEAKNGMSGFGWSVLHMKFREEMYAHSNWSCLKYPPNDHPGSALFSGNKTISYSNCFFLSLECIRNIYQDK
jgi:hypothetical protein